MPRTETEQRAFNLQCYGCDPDDFLDNVKDTLTYKHSGPEMVIISMLSNIQEMLDLNYDPNEIRQQINRVKYLVKNL